MPDGFVPVLAHGAGSEKQRAVPRAAAAACPLWQQDRRGGTAVAPPWWDREPSVLTTFQEAAVPYSV